MPCPSSGSVFISVGGSGLELRRVRLKVSVEREWSALSSGVFSGCWRLPQIHKRRLKLPGRRSLSDLSSPAFVFGMRRLLKICVAAQEPQFGEFAVKAGMGHSDR
ncbi:Uncharacterized protein Rs2_38880 [Raphanus sativus]|nr:Uncharacterized protein Rs2_38880 [Raphanus sativus]